MRTIPFIRNIRYEWVYIYPTFHKRLKLNSLRVSHVASVHSAVQLHMLGAVQVPPFSHIGSHTAVEKKRLSTTESNNASTRKIRIMVQPEFYIIILYQQINENIYEHGCL